MKTTSLLTFTAATLAVSVSAKEEFVKLIPNGANVVGVRAVGHSDGTGSNSARNAFGKAFDKAGRKWTTSLCQADSDGDGQTNGQELGDPCCEWKQGATPKFTEGVSHPGDASKKADPALWASTTCPATTAPASPAPAKTTTPLALLVGLAAGLIGGFVALGVM